MIIFLPDHSIYHMAVAHTVMQQTTRFSIASAASTVPLKHVAILVRTEINHCQDVEASAHVYPFHQTDE